MHLHRILFTLALIPSILSAQAATAADPLDALVKDSPFAPVAGAARASNGNTGPLEFRSVVFENGEFAFSLYDQASQQAAWVRIGETGQPFIVRSYDQERDVVTVEHQGRSVTLELQPGRMTDQPQVGSGPPSPGSPGSVPPLPNAAQMREQGGGPRPVNPGGATPAPPAPGMSEPESQRLQALADEIRRRRQSPLQASPK